MCRDMLLSWNYLQYSISLKRINVGLYNLEYEVMRWPECVCVFVNTAKASSECAAVLITCDGNQNRLKYKCLFDPTSLTERNDTHTKKEINLDFKFEMLKYGWVCKTTLNLDVYCRRFLTEV